MNKLYCACLCSLVAITSLAQAEDLSPTDKRPLEVVLSTKKVFNPGKKEDKIEATRVELGDTVEFTLTYLNPNYNPIRNVKAALPIPDGFVYINGSATPPLAAGPAGGFLVWTLGSIPSKKSVTMTARMVLQRPPAKK